MVAEQTPDSNPVVLVIDRQSTRGRAMAKQLSRYTTHAHRFYPFALTIKSEQGIPVPKEWDLALVHATDSEDFFKYLDGKKHSGRVIHYSGSSGHDKKIPYGSERMMRPIADSASPLSEEEVASLIRAARESTYPPPLTLEPLDLPLLRSLSVLSLLYLSVRAACMEPGLHLTGERLEPVAASTLEAIGWTKLPRSLRTEFSNHTDGLPSHLSDVQSSGWWRARLLAGPDPLTAGSNSDLERAKERNDAIELDPIRKLLVIIQDKQEQEIKLSSVVDCYTELLKVAGI